jgi:hypothetical protein
LKLANRRTSARLPRTHTLHQLNGSYEEVLMSDRKVIPFRKRPPSQTELEVYRQITRGWLPEMRQFMFPEHFKHDRSDAEDRPRE